MDDAAVEKIVEWRRSTGVRWQLWLNAKIKAYRQLHPRLLSSLLMMLAAGVMSLIAVAYAHAIDWATSAMAAGSREHQWWFIGLSPVWMVLAWALVRYCDRSAGGSGIPQVLAVISAASEAGKEQPRPSGWQNVRLVAVKICSSLAAILGGGAVGREGPTIQIAAAVFELFDGMFRRIVGRPRSRESLLIAGGAAGLAAAFNTPLGGVVFAIEELASDHFKTFKGVLILSVVTAGYATQAMLGPYLFVGHPAIGAVSGKDFITGLVVAMMIGLSGALFGLYLFKAVQGVNKLSTRTRFCLAAAVGLIMSSVCVYLGPDASGGGSRLIRGLLFGEVKDISWALAIWRVLGLVVTYISGCAGGIFAPCLAAGVALGAKLSTLFQSDNPNLMMVLGMIAFLSGATRSPFTSFILVFEMTDRQAAVVPMMAAALIATMVGRLVEEESFYEKTRDVLLGRTHAHGPKEDGADGSPPPPAGAAGMAPLSR